MLDSFYYKFAAEPKKFYKAEEVASKLVNFVRKYVLRAQDYVITKRVTPFQYIPVQMIDTDILDYTLEDLLSNPVVININDLYNYTEIPERHEKIYGNLIAVKATGKSIFQTSGQFQGTWRGVVGSVQLAEQIYQLPMLNEWDSYNSATKRFVSSTSSSVNLGNVGWVIFKEDENTDNSIVFISTTILNNISPPVDKNTVADILCEEFTPVTENDLLATSEDLLPNYEGIAVTYDGKLKIRVNRSKLADTENSNLLSQSFVDYCIQNKVHFLYKLRNAEIREVSLYFNDLLLNESTSVTPGDPAQIIELSMYNKKTMRDSIAAWNTQVPLIDKIKTLTATGDYLNTNFDGEPCSLRDCEVYDWYNNKLMYGVDYAFDLDHFFLIKHNNRDYPKKRLILKNIYADAHIPEERLMSIMPFQYTRLLSRAQYTEILQMFIENFLRGAQIKSLNETFDNYDPTKPIRVYDFYSAKTDKERNKWLHDGETDWIPSVDRYSIFDAVVELPEEYLSDVMMDGVTRLSYIQKFFKLIKPAHTSIYTDIMMRINDVISVFEIVITNYYKDFITDIWVLDNVLVNPYAEIPDTIEWHDESFTIYDEHLSPIDLKYDIDRTAEVMTNVSRSRFVFKPSYTSSINFYVPGRNNFIAILTSGDKVILDEVVSYDRNTKTLVSKHMIPEEESALYIMSLSGNTGGFYECCYLKLIRD